MRKLCLICIIPVSIILLSFSSCKRKKGNGINRPCYEPYTIKQLLKDYNSSKFVISKGKTITDVFDTTNTKGKDTWEMPIFRFDNSSGNLRIFAYRTDSTNGTSFLVTYDTLGNEIKRQGDDVVRWFIGKSRSGSDSIIVFFFLYKLNRSYGNLRLTGSNFSKPVTLFETDYANLIGMNVKISSHIKKTVYLSGLITNDCSNKDWEFKDSVFIPDFLLK